MTTLYKKSVDLYNLMSNDWIQHQWFLKINELKVLKNQCFGTCLPSRIQIIQFKSLMSLQLVNIQILILYIRVRNRKWHYKVLIYSQLYQLKFTLFSMIYRICFLPGFSRAICIFMYYQTSLNKRKSSTSKTLNAHKPS